MEKGRIDIVTMGCSKNLIDSEILMKRLSSLGYTVSHDSEDPRGEYVIVNTCGFIGDAKEESINLILQLAGLKKKNKIGKLVVMGCLSERYKKELPAEIPEVDIWYGKYDWKDFINNLPKKSYISSEKKSIPLKSWERTLTTPPWSAYVKISEGCNRHCAYCAIPIITGSYVSRPQQEILEEVSHLVAEGVKEFNIIAQDLSSYGLDIDGEHQLPELIDRMAKIEGVEWIRLHYLYPTDFPLKILDVINANDNVCKYLDIALQHISNKVLGPMNRHISKEKTLDLLNTIRDKVPGIHLRTTLMTGFPGEDEAAFDELMEFVREQRFERLGGFSYCEEEDTLAAKILKDEISDEIKKSRLSRIMELQQAISRDINEKKVGKVLRVLVERVEEGYCVGRTEFDSPEVDQEIIIEDCKAILGTFINVEITSGEEFELYGKQII